MSLSPGAPGQSSTCPELFLPTSPFCQVLTEELGEGGGERDSDKLLQPFLLRDWQEAPEKQVTPTWVEDKQGPVGAGPTSEPLVF